MPALDGTGPEGEGSRTGRGRGVCDNKQPSKTREKAQVSDRPRRHVNGRKLRNQGR